MTENDIRKAYCRIREIDHTIPDNVLDFMLNASIEAIRKEGAMPDCPTFACLSIGTDESTLTPMVDYLRLEAEIRDKMFASMGIPSHLLHEGQQSSTASIAAEDALNRLKQMRQNKKP